LFRKLSLIASLFFLLSCSENAPVINQVFWQINLRQGTDLSVREELNVFLQTSDEDGLEDLQSLYVINDERGTYWQVDKEEWNSKNIRKETWIGKSSLINNQSSYIDRDNYRVLIIDSAGSRDEGEISVNTPALDLKDIPFPRVSIETDFLAIESPKRVGLLIWFYDDAGNFLGEVKTAAGRVPMAPPNKTPTAVDSIEVYTYWPEKGVGLINGPIFLK